MLLKNRVGQKILTMTMAMIFIYTLAAKRLDSRTKLCECKPVVTNEHSSKTVQRYNMHTNKNTETLKTDLPKITGGI